MSTPLRTRVDWSGAERPASAAAGAAARVRDEVAEIRTAAEDLAAGGPTEVAVADFLTAQATLLERAGATAERADALRPNDDARE
ncbi:hypothetical protein [Streptomyces lincolnensis]|uniref:hypothetical protein n=1 Tax=Streptomyces lincolnensis TaxID=1915 RepID=UPI0037D92BEA